MDVVDLDFTTLHFYDKYLISHIKDDVVLDEAKTQNLINLCQEYYKGSPYVYLSKRKGSYNVVPMVYLNLWENPELLGIGIICEEIIKCKMAEFEKNFSSVPFQIFYTMESAVHWVESLHEKKIKAGL